MDVKQVAALLELEEDEIYDVLALFIQSAPFDLMKLASAYDNRDPVLAGEALHSLKGSAGTLGFTDISSQAQRIMIQARENRIEDLIRSLPPFLGRMQDLLAELRQVLDNRRDPYR